MDNKLFYLNIICLLSKKMDKISVFCPEKWTIFINLSYLSIFMDKYDFVKLMEQKKAERIKIGKKYRHRDIYFEISKMIKNKKKMFIFYGLRGIGKSISINQSLTQRSMFIDGTVLSYYDLDLIEVVNEYLSLKKTNILFIDEVSDIKNWDKALKILYDNFELKVVCTGSSAIGIRTKNSKILRRAVFKEVPPLTFREFLRLKYKQKFDVCSKELFLSSPEDAYVKAKAILMNLPDLVAEFREYIRYGFPLAFERPIEEVADSVVAKIILDDFPEISGFNIDVSLTARKIVNTLSLSKPDRISLSKFTDVAECSKTTASNILNAFTIASLLIPVLSEKSSVAKLRKEPKYLFSSSAIRYGLAKHLTTYENLGALREDTVVSAFKYAGFNVEYLSGEKKPDYRITYKNKSNIIEVGGPSKTPEQLDKGFLLVDSNKLDYSKGIVTLPLYLVGFLI